MKFNAVLTKEQAKEMFAYLEDIFTEVKVLDIEAVRRLEKDKNSILLSLARLAVHCRRFGVQAFTFLDFPTGPSFCEMICTIKWSSPLTLPG